MAEFNLPFGVRIAGDDPIDKDRYIAADITARDAIVTAVRAHNGLQVYVESENNLYVLKGTTNNDWKLVDGGYSTDYQLIRRFDETALLGGSVSANRIIKIDSATGKWIQASSLDEDVGRNSYLLSSQSGVLDDSIIGYNLINYKGNNSMTYGDPVYLGTTGLPTTIKPIGTVLQIGVVRYDNYGFWGDTDKFMHIDFFRQMGPSAVFIKKEIINATQNQTSITVANNKIQDDDEWTIERNGIGQISKTSNISSPSGNISINHTTGEITFHNALNLGDIVMIKYN